MFIEETQTSMTFVHEPHFLKYGFNCQDDFAEFPEDLLLDVERIELRKVGGDHVYLMWHNKLRGNKFLVKRI